MRARSIGDQQIAAAIERLATGRGISAEPGHEGLVLAQLQIILRIGLETGADRAAAPRTSAVRVSTNVSTLVPKRSTMTSSPGRVRVVATPKSPENGAAKPVAAVEALDMNAGLFTSPFGANSATSLD